MPKRTTTTPVLSPRSSRSSGERRSSAAQVVRALDDFCLALGPGGRIPTHTDLMSRFGASERAVRDALEELRRSGRIIRRNGVGTFVSSEPPVLRVPPSTVAENTIVAITRPDGSFFDRCLQLLFRYVEDAGLSLVCQTVDSFTTVAPGVSAALKPLGFVVFSYQLAPLAQRLQDEGHRVVLVSSPPTDVTPDVPCIYSDHEHGGYLVTNHLIQLGHRRIAFVHAGAGELQMQRRWVGHQRALRDARRRGLTVTDTILDDTEALSWESDPARATAFFGTPAAPTSLIAWNDFEAARLLSRLTRAGVKVPETVSIAGYDALPQSELVYPPLTTVDPNIDQQLRAAVDLLTRPTPPPPTQTVLLVPTLVPRESTAPPPTL